ncbi:hypothetical protein HPB47_028181 [Ixodes persulcatus]|uniref:Uncharacterized protein n=1 Tax=Ixodes persulcatus TaxID=34615 RepID=A0AC60PTV7_IXOPE|nr:hypothetical protein HPB47_028181 [Ixodes persulcatus]
MAGVGGCVKRRRVSGSGHCSAGHRRRFGASRGGRALGDWLPSAANQKLGAPANSVHGHPPSRGDEKLAAAPSLPLAALLPRSSTPDALGAGGHSQFPRRSPISACAPPPRPRARTSGRRPWIGHDDACHPQPSLLRPRKNVIEELDGTL